MTTWQPDGSTLILLDREFPKTEGGEMLVAGHVHFGPFPKVGDVATVAGKNGGEHFFRFSEVKLCGDPEAMYTGKIKRFRVDYEGETIWQEPPPRIGFFRKLALALGAKIVAS